MGPGERIEPLWGDWDFQTRSACVTVLKRLLERCRAEWFGRIERMENAVEAYMNAWPWFPDTAEKVRDAMAFTCIAATQEPGMPELKKQVDIVLDGRMVE